MHIQEALFVKSSTMLSQCPAPTKPEFAFVGRSNVGKSSLINLITQRKALANVSRRPGKTGTINHFLINQSWYLVDLPGYGYARQSKALHQQWVEMVAQYLSHRENLRCVFLLLDVRHNPQPTDLELLHHLQTEKKMVCLVLTKEDKLSKNELIAARKQIEHLVSLEIGGETPHILTTSTLKKIGREELHNFIEQRL